MTRTLREKIMTDLADGESTEVQGSGRKPYVLKNTGGVYSCSCPAWRNQSLGAVAADPGDDRADVLPRRLASCHLSGPAKPQTAQRADQKVVVFSHTGGAAASVLCS